jgi:hypothetical protein
MSLSLSSTVIQKSPTTTTFLHTQISPAGALDLSGDGDAEVVLGDDVFREDRRIAEARARREEEVKATEERRQLKLKWKLLMLHIFLASPWAIAHMTKGWRPQLSGHGIEEQIVAA